MNEHKTNNDAIDVTKLINNAIKNKFTISLFGVLFTVIGFLVLNSIEKIYRSEIRIEALKDFSYFMSGENQEDFRDIGFTPYSIADRMILNATSLELTNKVGAKYDNPDVSMRAVQDQYGQKETLGIYWTLSATGNFKNKEESEKFLEDLTNLAYNTTMEKISERLVDNYRQMSEYIKTKLIIHSELIDQKKERIKTYLSEAKRKAKSINNQKQILIQNELRKAEILNLENPSSSMVRQNNTGSIYIEESNYITQQVESDEEGSQGINDEKKDIFELKDFSPKIETLFFLGKNILEEELKFTMENQEQKNEEIIALETELKSLDDQKKPAFIKDLNKYIDKENQYLFYIKIFDSAFDQNNTAVNYRTHLIKSRITNVVPMRFSLPIIFLIGIFVGFIYIVAREAYQKD